MKGYFLRRLLEIRTYDDIYTASKKEFNRSGSGTPSDVTAWAVMKAEDAIKAMQAEFEDILAVEKTMLQLNKQQRKAVEIVYFTEPEKDLEKGDISDRVHKAELAIPASEQSVYNWLKKARRTFAKERGLKRTRETRSN